MGQQRMTHAGVAHQVVCDRVYHRNFDVLPLASAGFLQSGENADCGRHCGHLVDYDVFYRTRPALCPLGEHDARDSLDNRIVGGFVAIRTFETVPGDRAVHDLGIAFRHCLVTDTETVYHPRPHVLDHNVGLLRHPQENFRCARLLEIEDHASLAAVPVEDSDRHPVALRTRDDAHHVPLGRLDLYDVGAQVAEDHRAKWTGDDHAQVQNLEAFKRTHRVTLHRSYSRSRIVLTTRTGQPTRQTLRRGRIPARWREVFRFET